MLSEMQVLILSYVHGSYTLLTTALFNAGSAKVYPQAWWAFLKSADSDSETIIKKFVPTAHLCKIQVITFCRILCNCRLA